MLRPTALLALPLVCSPALAQDIVPLILAGDPIPTMADFRWADRVWVNNRGDWFADVLTWDSNPALDEALLKNGEPLFKELHLLDNPQFSWIRIFDELGVNDLCNVGAVFYMGNDGQGLFWNDVLLEERGTQANLAGFPANATWGLFFAASNNNADQILTVANIDHSGSVVGQAIVLYDAAGGVVANREVIVQSGDVLPGQTAAVAFVGLSPFPDTKDFDLNDAGQVVFRADLGDGSDVIYLDDVKVAQTGDPSPVAGRNLVGFGAWPTINALGKVAYRGYLDGDHQSADILVYDGQKVIQEGDVPADIAPFRIIGIDSDVPLDVANTGDVLWYGFTSHSAPNYESLWLNDRLLVQRGVTQVGGLTVQSMSTSFDGERFAISDNGAYVVFQASLTGGVRGVFMIDLSLGTTYCSPAVANSTGEPAVLKCTGSDLAGGRPLRLSTSDLPPQQFAYFIASQTQGNVPMASGGQGTLCLGGSIARFNAQVQSTGAAGYVEIGVDTNAIPANPTVAILAGETWNWQCWYRDFNPTPTSNFSDAVSVTFQ